MSSNQDTLAGAIETAMAQTQDGSTGAGENSQQQTAAGQSGAQGDPNQQPFGDQPPAGIAPPEFQEIEAPAFWKPGARDAWKALQAYREGAPHLKAIHEQWLETQKHFTQHQQQFSEFRRNFEPIGQFLQPYAQQWARDGMGPLEGLRQIMSWRDGLLQDPKGTILELARSLGVDLAQATEDQPWVDPVTQALQDRVNQAEAKLRQFEESGIQQQQQAVFAQVEAFKNQTDAQGNLLHPFLDQQVLNDMLHFYSTGRAKDPETAYRMAVQYSPEYQQHAAAEADRKAREQAAQQQQAAQQAARIAGKGPTAAVPGAGGKPGPASIREAINLAMGQ